MTKYTALVIEPRQHKALSFVLNNFLSNLSEEWEFIVFHGKKNIKYVKKIVSDLEKIYRSRTIKLINLYVDNLTTKQYSDLLKSEEFYSHIHSETFLIFQTDSIILKKNKDTINIFLNYDYVGAPWSLPSDLETKIGNGGLSIRKKNKMLEIIKAKGKETCDEDIYFSCNIGENICYNVPHYTEAKMFSVETMFYSSPFGIHKCWKHLKPELLYILINEYPEIQELINLQ